MASPDVYTLFAGADERCPYQVNDVFTKEILSYADSTNVMGANHMGFLGANDLSFMSLLEPMLPLLQDPMMNTLYCPADDVCSKKSGCSSKKSGSNKSKKGSKKGSNKAPSEKSEKAGSDKSDKEKSVKAKSNKVKSEKSGSDKSQPKAEKQGSDKSRSGSKAKSNKSDKSEKGKKSKKPTKFTIGFTQDDNVDSSALDNINLNKFNVDFDADEAGYQSEEVEVKSVSQLEGVYSSNGRFNGDERRAERRTKHRSRTQLNYLTQLKTPIPTGLND